MWVDNKSVCTFSMDNKIREYEWDLIFTSLSCKGGILLSRKFSQVYLNRGFRRSDKEICK